MFRSLAILAFSVFVCGAVEVRVVSWETAHAAPAAKLDEGRKDLLPLIRLGVSALPEAKVMQLTFVGGAALGLPVKQARTLHAVLSKRYGEIGEDEVFSAAPSALGYCYSAVKPKEGFATVYLPDLPTAETKVILFLHGYGGSFKFYVHYLARVFPDHIIVCPAYGISASDVPSAYLRECLEAVGGEVGFDLKRPVLMGLSAGGFGGFREYARSPGAYMGFVCMAAFPPEVVMGHLPRDGRIRLVAGGDEGFVRSGVLRRGEIRLKRRVSDYSSVLIPDAGHFFMLSAEEETGKVLERWDGELQSGR